MELALYHPEIGYYARAAQRSGRAGDFVTSVDVGPLFGELLEVQLAEMADILAACHAEQAGRPPDRNPAANQPNSASHFDLVEAAAGHPARGAASRSRLLQSHPPPPRRGQRRRPR
jgi:hypothetical protein